MSSELVKGFQNQAGRESQSCRSKRNFSTLRYLTPSPLSPFTETVLFQAPSVFDLPTSRLGKRETKWGASTKTSCPARTILSSHLAMREAAIRAVDSLSNSPNLTLSGLSPLPRNSLEDRGRFSDICLEKPRYDKTVRLRLFFRSLTRCSKDVTAAGRFGQ